MHLCASLRVDSTRRQAETLDQFGDLCRPDSDALAARLVFATLGDVPNTDVDVGAAAIVPDADSDAL